MAMNIDRHVKAHRDLYDHLANGDLEKAKVTKAFYDEYFAVLDLAAEFYLETVRIAAAIPATGFGSYIPHVQDHRDHPGHNADRSLPPRHLHALEEEIAGRIRIQEAARSCGLADPVLHRMRDRLCGRKIDLSVLDLTAHRTLLIFVELGRNDIRLVIFEPQAMQQRAQSRTAFVNEAKFLFDPGTDLARRARQRRADVSFQSVFLRGT
jgi:hypothetical protein